MDTFDTRLSNFTNFCETDTVFRVIHQELMNNQNVNLRAWFDDKMSRRTGWVGGSPLQFPNDPDERVSLMYQLVVAIQSGQINFQNFLFNFFAVGTSKINHFIQAFQEGVLQPLLRDLTYRLEALEARLPQQGTTEVPTVTLHILHNSGPIIQQVATGSNITQNASQQIQNPEIQRLFSEIVEIVRTANLTPQQQTDAREILASVEEELRMPSPRRSIVQAMLNGLPIAASIAEIIAAIVGML